jgi:hypothetical protein
VPQRSVRSSGSRAAAPARRRSFSQNRGVPHQTFSCHARHELLSYPLDILTLYPPLGVQLRSLSCPAKAWHEFGSFLQSDHKRCVCMLMLFLNVFFPCSLRSCSYTICCFLSLVHTAVTSIEAGAGKLLTDELGEESLQQLQSRAAELLRYLDINAPSLVQEADPEGYSEFSSLICNAKLSESPEDSQRLSRLLLGGEWGSQLRQIRWISVVNQKRNFTPSFNPSFTSNIYFGLISPQS